MPTSIVRPAVRAARTASLQDAAPAVGEDPWPTELDCDRHVGQPVHLGLALRLCVDGANVIAAVEAHGDGAAVGTVAVVDMCVQDTQCASTLRRVVVVVVEGDGQPTTGFANTRDCDFHSVPLVRGYVAD